MLKLEERNKVFNMPTMKNGLVKWLPIMVLLLISNLIGGCDEVDRRLTIVNKSNKAVFYVLSKDNILDENSPNYKNKLFTITNQQDTQWINQDYLVKPHSANTSEILRANGWTIFINGDCQDSTLNIFFFDALELSNTPWEEIKNKNKYIQLYRLKVEELEKNNWNVILKN